MGSGQSASKQIGGQGGELSLEGVTLTIPPGALANDQVIVVTSTTTRPPAQFTHWSSPVYQFEPAGLTFAIPATVRISFAADAGAQSIYWSSADASTFENLGGVATGSVIATPVMHFSQGFVAPSVGSPPVDASPDGPVDAAGDRPIDANTPDASVDAAITDAVASGDAASCASIGQSCGSPTQCCSLSCAGGICTTGSSCTPAGTSCSSGAQCCSGNCVGSQCASCPAGQTLCTGSCADLSTDPRNCGTCGHACSSGQLCVTGTCAAGA